MPQHDRCTDDRFTINGDGWRRWDGGRAWKQERQGTPIFVEDQETAPRSNGEPLSALTGWLDDKGSYLAGIKAVAEVADIHPATALATLLVEAWPPKGTLYHRDPLNMRHEPGYVDDASTPHKASYGKAHTLLSTAQNMEDRFDLFGQKVEMWSLYQPSRSIAYMIAYLADRAEKYGTLDPMLLQSAYNAGSLYTSEHDANGDPNPFLLGVYDQSRHMKFIKYHNDFVLTVDWTDEAGVWP